MSFLIKPLTLISKTLLHIISPDGGIPLSVNAKRIPRFYGSIAVPSDLGNKNRCFSHPYLASEGVNGMHGDSYNTDAYPFSSVLGNTPLVRSKALNVFGGMLATIMFDSKGRIIAVSGNIAGFRLLLMDPESLEILAETRLPQRASTKQFFKTLDFKKISTDTSGGAYFHLLKGDRPIIGNSQNVIQIFRIDETGNSPAWIIEKEWDVSSYLPEGSYLQDVIPDYHGNKWFSARCGQVGFIDEADAVHVMTIEGEEIHNALAVGEDGVFLNTDYAQYKFGIDERGSLQIIWRTEYDRGTSAKPGSILQGSGTTPTLLDVQKRDGTTSRLVALADNADDRIHIVIIDRDTGSIISQVPLFDHWHSTTENSIIAYDRSFIIENNYSPNGAAFLKKDPKGYPGVARVDVNEEVTRAYLVWESREASPTTVPKLSIKNGLIYLYTREMNKDIPQKTVAWYLTAIDFKTGKTVFKILTGTGIRWNNSYAPITLGPNNTAYIGVFNGVVSVSDRKE